MATSSLILILIAVVCGVSGQIALKLGMVQVGQIGSDALAQPIAMTTRVLTTPLVLVGLAFYVIGAAVWMTVLSRVPLSLAYPSLALSYAVTPFLAWILLGETVPSLRWLGIATICVGVAVVSRS